MRRIAAQLGHCAESRRWLLSMNRNGILSESQHVSQAPLCRVRRVRLILTLGQTDAKAQQKPFAIDGVGYAPDGINLTPGTPGPHWAVGTATELGAYYGAGFFELLEYTGPTTAEFSSAPDFVFTAANGDELAVTYGVVSNGASQPGQLTLYPHSDGSFSAVFVAEFNPIPSQCTGRFAKITSGSFLMIAVSEPFFFLETTTTPFAYAWAGEGSLTYGKGK